MTPILKAEIVAMPALATGYGPLCMAQSAEALRQALPRTYEGLTELRMVLASDDDSGIVRDTLRAAGLRIEG